MNILQGDSTVIPEEQRAIRAKCVHPTGTFIPFPTEAIDQSIPERFEHAFVFGLSNVTQHKVAVLLVGHVRHGLGRGGTMIFLSTMTCSFATNTVDRETSTK